MASDVVVFTDGNDDLSPRSGRSEELECTENYTENVLNNASDEKLTNKPKTAHDFHQLVQLFKNKPITKGYVYCLYTDFNKNITKTASKLIQIAKPVNTKIASLKSAIEKLLKKIRQLKKNVQNHWSQIELFLAENFKFPEIRPAPISTTTVDSTLPVSAGDQSLDQTVPISPLMTRTDKRCHSCAIKKESNIQLRNINKKLKLSCSLEKQAKFMIKKKYQVRLTNQSLKRKDERINRYKKKIAMLQTENKSLDKSLTRYKTKYRSLINSVRNLRKTKLRMETTISDLQAKLSAKDSNI